MVKTILIFFAISIWLSFMANYSDALTVEEIIRLKEVGVDDKTIQWLIEREKRYQEGSEGLGVREIKKPNGQKDKIYYSITTPEGETESQKEEREKLEKSLEILRNIIIDERKK